MLLLSQEDIQKCINISQTISLMAEAFIELSLGDGEVPVRHVLMDEAKQTTGLFMPAMLPQSDALGIKIVGMNPQNLSKQLPFIHASIPLLDTETGQPAAMMDGSWITALRTGAGSGLATQLLAKEDAKILVVFGAGVQAKTQIEAVCAVRDIKSVKVINRTESKVKQFCKDMSQFLGLPFSLGSHADLKEADIICTATTSSNPLFEHHQLTKGCHINAIGAYQPTMAEIPSETVAKSKIIVDRTDACLEEAGDIIQAIQKGVILEKDIYGEIGEIAGDKLAARENEDEITLFKSVGNAAQDMVVARYVFDVAREKGLGQHFEF